MGINVREDMLLGNKWMHRTGEIALRDNINSMG